MAEKEAPQIDESKRQELRQARLDKLDEQYNEVDAQIAELRARKKDLHDLRVAILDEITNEQKVGNEQRVGMG